MPRYDYECRTCGTRFEVRQRVADDPLSTCPTCGGTVRRVFHPVGIIFKGSGFYVTDNRKGEAVPTAPSSDETSGGEPKKPADGWPRVPSAEPGAPGRASSGSESKPAASATG